METISTTHFCAHEIKQPPGVFYKKVVKIFTYVVVSFQIKLHIYSFIKKETSWMVLEIFENAFFYGTRFT